MKELALGERQLRLRSEGGWSGQRVEVGSHVPYSIALIVLVLVVFATTVGTGFLSYDHPLMLSDNPVVQQGLRAEGLRYASTDTTMNLWIPLRRKPSHSQHDLLI